MRMWMVDPKIMCSNHILGEHNELHMLVGYLRTGRRLGRYLSNGLVDPSNIVVRHNQIVEEFSRRGWKSGYDHHTPITDSDLADLSLVVNSIDAERTLADLLARCQQCRSIYREVSSVRDE